MKKIFLIMAMCVLSGCLFNMHAKEDFMNPKHIGGVKEVTIKTGGQPWGAEVERELRARGFKVVRYNTTARFESDDGEHVVFAKVKTRLFLDVKGSFNKSNPCWGGGYMFYYINAELVDTHNSETIAYYSNKGPSEDCPPLSQPIFGDIAAMVDNYF